MTGKLQHPLFAAILGLLAIALVQPVASAHDEYRSFSQLSWNDADGSIELVMQIHSHELETKLSLLLDQRLSFLIDGDFNKLEAATKTYISDNIAVRIDDTPVAMIFLGIETDGQTVTAYLEADWTSRPQSIDFMNSIFLNDLPGQINSVLATVMGIRKSGDIIAGSDPVRFVF